MYEWVSACGVALVSTRAGCCCVWLQGLCLSLWFLTYKKEFSVQHRGTFIQRQLRHQILRVKSWKGTQESPLLPFHFAASLIASLPLRLSPFSTTLTLLPKRQHREPLLLFCRPSLSTPHSSILLLSAHSTSHIPFTFFPGSLLFDPPSQQCKA